MLRPLQDSTDQTIICIFNQALVSYIRKKYGIFFISVLNYNYMPLQQLRLHLFQSLQQTHLPNAVHDDLSSTSKLLYIVHFSLFGRLTLEATWTRELSSGVQACELAVVHPNCRPLLVKQLRFHNFQAEIS